MPTQVILELPDQIYERAQYLAQSHEQNLAQAIVAYLDDHLPVRESSAAASIKPRVHSVALERERSAYLKMHTWLKENFFGKHVAIYQGELIDSDDVFDVLYERIRQHYPGKIVWLSLVKDEPIETIFVRSPRLGRRVKR